MKTQFLSILRNFTVSVEFSSKFTTSSSSTKIQDFFENFINSFLLKRPVMWTFWFFSPSESHSSENSLPLAIFQRSRFFPENLSSFFKKTQFLNVLRSFGLSVANYSKSVILRYFKRIKTFFRKKYIFSGKTPKIGRFQNPHSSCRIQQQIW